jgi:hypothetical protein
VAYFSIQLIIKKKGLTNRQKTQTIGGERHNKNPTAKKYIHLVEMARILEEN